MVANTVAAESDVKPPGANGGHEDHAVARGHEDHEDHDDHDDHDDHEVARTDESVRASTAWPVAWFIARQLILVVGAVVAYFGVRGLTEGSVDLAHRNAEWVLDLERSLRIAVEDEIQDAAARSDAIVTLGNWVYIWLHWPLVVGTLLWLALAHRDDYVELRNAMFISGAIGLVIFATFPVAPPRLLGPEYVDTVTLRSHSYRVLQPPGFVNAYAAVPSLHFGWNLLVGMTWYRVGRRPWWKVAGVAMPAAMAWAVVVTANHWVVDVVTGGAVALAGLAIQRVWHRERRSKDTMDAA